MNVRKILVIRALHEVLQSNDQHELLEEELGVEYGDVSGAANQSVRCVRQGMEHVVTHKLDVALVNDRLEDVRDHLGIHRTCAR